MTPDGADDFDDREDLEAAVRRAAREGVEEALEPIGWGALGVVVVLAAALLISTGAFGGLIVVPGLVAVLFGLYLVGFAIHALVSSDARGTRRER